MPDPATLDLDEGGVEEIARVLYIRALTMLPPTVRQGFQRLNREETDPTAQTILRTMIDNIAVADTRGTLLCQDTGLPIYTVTIGRAVHFDGLGLQEAIRRGVARATREHPLRSSVVHPITRTNEHTSCGRGIPVIHIGFDESVRQVRVDMVPKGSGSENGSFLKMLVPADGLDGIKTFIIDCVIQAGGRVCPPTIVGVGIGGTSDLCMHLAKIAATRPLGSVCDDPEGASLEAGLSAAVNTLGIGPQGLGGRATAFAVHVETAATHITMNPVAVNIQCHSARRASAILSEKGVAYGF